MSKSAAASIASRFVRQPAAWYAHPPSGPAGRATEGRPHPGQRYRHGWIPVTAAAARDAEHAQRIRDVEQHVEKLRREGPPPYQRDPERYDLAQLKDPDYLKVTGEEAASEIERLTQMANDLRRRRGRPASQRG